jgi:hypothetical protein
MRYNRLEYLVKWKGYDESNCKGTSVHFLTSPILSHSSPVHMYSLSLPLYYLQGPMVRRLSRS